MKVTIVGIETVWDSGHKYTLPYTVKLEIGDGQSINDALEQNEIPKNEVTFTFEGWPEQLNLEDIK